MTFAVNGQDIMPYLKFGGLKYSRNDIDGPNAGRGLDGTMIRDRVAIKARWDGETKPMPLSDAQTLMMLLKPQYVTVVTDFNPEGTMQTYKAYSNNIVVPFLMYRDINGTLTPWVTSFSFPLVEV